jgi:hypothetical protein
MRKQNSTMTVEELALLASCGLVANDDQGRQAFIAWLTNDAQGGAQGLFSRVAAGRVAGSATWRKDFDLTFERTPSLRRRCRDREVPCRPLCAGGLGDGYDQNHGFREPFDITRLRQLGRCL